MQPLAAIALSVAAAAGLAASVAVAAAPLQVQMRPVHVAPSTRDLPPYADGWRDGSLKLAVASGGPPEVVARINEVVALATMRIAAPDKPGATVVLPDGVKPEGLSELSFEVGRNDARVFALAFTGESCGAYCEPFTGVANFDARGGRAIGLDDLVAPAALATIARRVDAERTRLYAQAVKDEKQVLGEQGGDKDAVEDARQRLALNQDCLAKVKELPTTPDSLRNADLSLQPGRGLALRTGRCSNHAERALDDVDDVTLTLAPAELAPLLTPYGRAIVLGDGDAPAPSTAFGQVLHGKVGAAPVTLWLDRPQADGSIHGLYFYDRYRKPIGLWGKRRGDTVDFEEDTDAKAHLVLTLHGLAAEGQWRGAGKALPVSLAW